MGTAVTSHWKISWDIDFSPSWNIRREPEHMEGDETCILYNFYDDTAKHSDSVFWYFGIGKDVVYWEAKNRPAADSMFL